MKIKVIKFDGKATLVRAHYNDAGADVSLLSNVTIKKHETKVIPLGFGLDLPDGYMANIIPRSSIAKSNVEIAYSPVDSGYKGEIHAIVHNLSDRVQVFNIGDRIGQLVISPIIVAEFVTDLGNERGAGAFGSTGK